MLSFCLRLSIRRMQSFLGQPPNNKLLMSPTQLKAVVKGLAFKVPCWFGDFAGSLLCYGFLVLGDISSRAWGSQKSPTLQTL